MKESSNSSLGSQAINGASGREPQVERDLRKRQQSEWEWIPAKTRELNQAIQEERKKLLEILEEIKEAAELESSQGKRRNWASLGLIRSAVERKRDWKRRHWVKEERNKRRKMEREREEYLLEEFGKLPEYILSKRNEENNNNLI